MKMSMTYIGDKVTDTSNTVVVWVQLGVGGKKNKYNFFPSKFTNLLNSLHRSVEDIGTYAKNPCSRLM